MKKELPKFNETFNPILDILSNGEVIKSIELLNRVVEKHYKDLPKELLEQRTKSGKILLLDRISWGKSYLKKGGYLMYPTRGRVQITEKGKSTLNENINLKDIEKSNGFFNFYNKEKSFEDEEIKTSSPQDLIEKGFDDIESLVKFELLEKLKKIDPFYFEKIILLLLKEMGYGDFIETPKSNDGGIDGIINEDKLGLDKIYIQAKRYGENKVREKDIRNFIGAMSGDTTKGVFVTTSDFDKGAIIKAHDAIHTIILINGFKLVDLMYQYNVGIQEKKIYKVKELDEDFFEE